MTFLCGLARCVTCTRGELFSIIVNKRIEKHENSGQKIMIPIAEIKIFIYFCSELIANEKKKTKLI